MTSPPTKSSPSEAGACAPLKSRRLRALEAFLALAWVVNVSLLVFAFAWLYRDGRSLGTIQAFAERLKLPAVTSLPDVPAWSGSFASKALTVGTVAAAVTFLAMACGLFVGSRRMRSLRAWLLFTGVTSGWLALAIGWPNIYWMGQQHRVRAMLRNFEPMVEMLNNNWPTGDGENAQLGPYLAYPQGKPRSIMRLHYDQLPATNLEWSGVERTDDRAMRFELSGADSGAWLEWRPDDSEPAPFVSGLNVSYAPSRFQQIAPRWYLTWYAIQWIGGM